MSFLGEFNIDDYVWIPAAAHDTSGSAADLDSGSVSVSFYENMPGSAATLSAMATPDFSMNSKIDGKTGFYGQQVQVSATNGFAANGQYIALIHGGTFDSQNPHAMWNFRVKGRGMYPRKGKEFTIDFLMKDASGNAASGLTITATISKDGGNYTPSSNTATETQTSGTYQITIIDIEMNANRIKLSLADAAASAKTTYLMIITQDN